MAVKTITIDLEAYDALKRRKKSGQSFSQVIKEHLPREKTVQDLLDVARRIHLSESTLDAVEEQIQRRREDPVRSVDL